MHVSVHSGGSSTGPSATGKKLVQAELVTELDLQVVLQQAAISTVTSRATTEEGADTHS